MENPPLIVSLDNMQWGTATQFAKLVCEKGPLDHIWGFKVNALVIGVDFNLWRRLREDGMKLILDLKWIDNPDTVASYVEKCAPYVDAFIVAAAGGVAMMKSAVQAAHDHSEDTSVFAVTVLTGMNDHDCRQSFGGNVIPTVWRFAHMAAEAGVDGVVCAGTESEAGAIKNDDNTRHLEVAAVGLRFKQGAKHDQKRWSTPRQAHENNADKMILGRIVTEHKQPIQQLNRVIRNIEGRSMHNG